MKETDLATHHFEGTRFEYLYVKFMRESEKYNEQTKRKNVPKYFNVNHKQRPNRGTYAYTTENANEGLEMS